MSKDNAHEVYVDDQGREFIIVDGKRIYLDT
jgi:hypothetical protein